MSGYLDSFVGLFLKFFKKNDRRNGNAYEASVYFTPPRRCNSVIEDRRLKEVLTNQGAKPKGPWSSTVGTTSKRQLDFLHDNRYVDELFDPATSQRPENVLDQNGADRRLTNERGDGMKSSRECCIHHEENAGGTYFPVDPVKDYPPFAEPLELPRDKYSEGSQVSSMFADCNSVIEDRRLKDIANRGAKPKGAWSSTSAKQPEFPHDNRYVNKFSDLPTSGKFQAPNGVDERQRNGRGDCLESHRECIYHDAADGFSKEFPPVSIRKMKPLDHAPYGLRRSSSLESCWPTENRKRMNSHRMFQMRHNPRPTENAGGTYFPVDPVKDYPPFAEPLELPRDKYSEGSQVSSMFADDHRHKTSKIPVYRKKHLPAKVSKSMPHQQFEDSVHREPECTCFREFRSIPDPRGWRAQGHAIHCPKSVVAHRSFLNTRLENLFRVVSKKKYCGNIIDAASHGRWMRLAGVGVDEDATCFKKVAKGRVVLAISEYKKALQQLCVERQLDYWYLVRKMTDVEVGSGADSNSTNSTILERNQTNKRSI